MPSILLARHGQASFGASEYDVLSGDGDVQAAALAAELAQRQLTVDQVVSGALARQRDTAAPIAEAYGVEIAQDPRWDEYEMDDILHSHSDTTSGSTANRASTGRRSPAASSRTSSKRRSSSGSAPATTGPPASPGPCSGAG